MRTVQLFIGLQWAEGLRLLLPFTSRGIRTLPFHLSIILRFVNFASDNAKIQLTGFENSTIEAERKPSETEITDNSSTVDVLGTLFNMCRYRSDYLPSHRSGVPARERFSQAKTFFLIIFPFNATESFARMTFSHRFLLKYKQ